MKLPNEPEGSLWRRWDLHLHTPDTRLANSFEGAGTAVAWEKYIDILEASPVSAFGITDYFGIDAYFNLVKKYEARYPETRKVFFPNIELRLAESISASGSHPHLHIIFDNNVDICDADVLKRFCTNLQTQAADGSEVRIRCIDLKRKAEVEAATVSLDDVEEALRQTFGNARPFMLAFPANNDGLRSTDSGSPRKVQIADRLDRTCDIFFGTAANREFLLKTDRYATGRSEPKPVVSGSDSHSFDDLTRLGGDVSGFPATWIKSDLTFRGLQQICFEPDDRVFIGDEPDVLKRQAEDGTKFLRRLEIDQNTGYDERNGKWFKGVSLPLNPELTAIIGNKGSCKSAVVDILGLLGESRQEAYFSFLVDGTKNKKFRQAGFADNFNASITWATGKRSSKSLSDKADVLLPESIRYLPQNYFEQLTNEIEIEKFRREIEEVVFSHVDESDRLGKTNFQELEEFTTLQGKQEISALKRRLRELNVEIVRLEKQGSQQFRKQLEGLKKAKAEELAALDSAKPKEVPKPDAATPEQIALATQVDNKTAVLTSLNARTQAALERIANLKTELQRIVSLQERLMILKGGYDDAMVELAPQLVALGLSVEQIILIRVDVSPVVKKAEQVRSQLADLEGENETVITEQTDLQKLVSLSDLRSASAFVSKAIEELKESLSTPQRQHQVYLERHSAWVKRRVDILGDEVEPKPDTLRGVEAQIRFLDENLASELAVRRDDRDTISASIFNSKRKVLTFYSNLKHSVEKRLSAVRTEDFSIEIDASFVADREFPRKFLALINQRKRGPFRDNQEALKYLSKLASETNWNDASSAKTFADSLIIKMKSHNGEPLEVEDQAHDVKELYDFLYSLEYFDAKYELRLSGKSLNELSPGEKGLLLLVFYLQLDRKSIPLVIDQPEDNLDNDSIFQVLAKCIREAKKVRQVVLVTHNPNLAVGADAEQVVYVKLDKTKSYQFSWESGAIENPAINRRIVDILEGSQPAFVKRRLKYGIA